MKNTNVWMRVLGIIAMAAVIGFGFAACGGDDDGGGGGGGGGYDSPEWLRGTYTHSSGHVVIVEKTTIKVTPNGGTQETLSIFESNSTSLVEAKNAAGYGISINIDKDNKTYGSFNYWGPNLSQLFNESSGWTKS